MKRRMNCAALALLMLLLSACGATAETAETPKETADAVTAATETAVDVIFAAGTTQSFTDEAVPQEDIETILRAGLAAESALILFSDKTLQPSFEQIFRQARRRTQVG